MILCSYSPYDHFLHGFYNLFPYDKNNFRKRNIHKRDFVPSWWSDSSESILRSWLIFTSLLGVALFILKNRSLLILYLLFGVSYIVDGIMSMLILGFISNSYSISYKYFEHISITSKFFFSFIF